MTPDFVPWGKIPRLNRNIVVTEKIDGTNAAIHITDEGTYAQSRNRMLNLDAKNGDNMGFLRWVLDNEGELREDLGPGLHFGEWYGQGIQRAYGLDHKRFALFNAARFTEAEPFFKTPNLEVVPVLYEGPFWVPESDMPITAQLVDMLRTIGSVAVPGFDRPEGIVMFHKAAGQMFKVTLEGDESPKGAAHV